jgi:lycopene cyclase CruP
VVGSCAQGYDQNEIGDLIATTTAIAHDCQYFWEAFPARDGRTTYLFTYLDLHPDRLSLEFLFSEYFRLLPDYQKIDLAQLDWQRFLFGFFPAYRHSPLHFPWGRALAVGDSAGGQSPVSFGGFGAMVRHLSRLSQGIAGALQGNYLSASDLALLQPYQPNIGVTWLFQQTMSVKVGQPVNPDQINRLMSGVFKVMAAQGDDVLRPFLQDVIQLGGLTSTLPRVNPLLVLPLLPQVGVLSLLDWLRHYGALAAYSAAYPVANQWLSGTKSFQQKRWLEAWRYGAGLDWHG